MSQMLARYLWMTGRGDIGCREIWETWGDRFNRAWLGRHGDSWLRWMGRYWYQYGLQEERRASLRGKDECSTYNWRHINELVRNSDVDPKIEMRVDCEDFRAISIKMAVETYTCRSSRQKVKSDKKRPMIQFWETLTITGGKEESWLWWAADFAIWAPRKMYFPWIRNGELWVTNLAL